MRKIEKLLAAAAIVVAVQLSAFAAVSVDRLLTSQVAALPLGLTPVIITFDHQPTSSDLTMLRGLGITGGIYLQQLPIVMTKVNLAQLNALKTKSGIRSLYANRRMRLFDLEGRTITGVEGLIRDSQVTTRNSGTPVSGKNIGIAYVDTGIDATHPDLVLGQNVAQNVYFATADLPLEDCGVARGDAPPTIAGRS